MGRIIRIGLKTLAATAGVVILLLIFINLPFSRNYVTRQVNKLFTRLELPMHIQSIHAVRLKSVHVEGFSIVDPRNDTPVYAGRVKARYGLLALTRKQVKLKDVVIEGVSVELRMNEETGLLNIAEAFPDKKKQVDPEQNKSNWEISIRNVDLSQLKFLMEDKPIGTRISQELSAGKIKDLHLSLGNRQLAARMLELSRARGNIVLNPPTTTELTPEKERKKAEKQKRNAKGQDISASPWNFGVGKLALEEIDFQFDQKRDSLQLKLMLSKGALETKQMDLSQKVIHLEEIYLEGLDAGIYTGQGSGNKKTGKSMDMDFPWDLKTRKADLSDVSLTSGVYEISPTYTAAPALAVENVDIRLRDFFLNEVDAGLDLRRLRFRLSNGFSLEQLEAELNSEPGSTDLTLALKTENSQLEMEAAASAGFFPLLGNPAALPAATLKFHQALISIQDLGAFYPLIKELPAYPLISGSPLKLDARGEKQNDTLLLEDLKLSQDQHFQLTMRGRTELGPDTLHTPGSMEVELKEIHTPWLKKVLSAFNLESAMPDSTELEVFARISDSFKSPDLEARIWSNQGQMTLDGKLNPDQQDYALSCLFKQVQLGHILANPDLGAFTGSVLAFGSGFSLENLEAEAQLRIDSLDFNNYTYTRTHMEAWIRPSNYELSLHADDPSLRADLELAFLQTDSSFRAEAEGDMYARLGRLHLYGDTLTVDSKLKAGFNRTRNTLDSDMHLQDITLTIPGQSAELEELKASFRTDSVSTALSGEGDFLNLELELGKTIYELDSLEHGYRKYLRSFIDPEHSDGKHRVSFLPEIYAQGYVNYHDALSLFIGDPEFSFSTIAMSMINRSSEDHIDYSLSAKDIRNQSLEMEDLELVLKDSAGMLNLAVWADSTSLFSGPRNHLQLRSRFVQRQSENELVIYDTLNQVTYRMDLSSRIDSNMMTVSAPTRRIILNREAWELESPELLRIDLNTRTLFPELSMFTDASHLQLSTREHDGYQRYTLDLRQLDITSMLPKGLLPGKPDGSLSGTLSYDHLDSTTRKISTDLNLQEASFSDLRFQDVSIAGDFSFSDSGEYTLKLSAHLDSSNMQLQGKNATLSPRSMQASFSRIPVNMLEPFARKHISNLKGSISGDLSLATREGKEHLEGQLQFEDAGLRVNTLNASYRIPDQRIRLDQERLTFDKFRVLDSLNKSLLVNGYIDFSNREKLKTSLDISTSRLQLMNREPSSDASLYGNIFVDSRIAVKGPLTNPTVDGRILLSRGTEIFYQRQEDLTVTESSKYVNFVNYDEEGQQIIAPTLSGSPAFNNSSVKTLVEIDPTTRINFNLKTRIYQVKLRIQGGGALNYSMLNQNQSSLSGTYNIGEGSCELRLVGWPSKTFDISEGAFVRWDGNLENPELNLTAVNKVASSYQNPLDGQQRSVDFNVILQLSQHLSDLDIVLTFDTPDQYLMSIINTLSPEDQMRQAITILLFETVDLPGISTTSDYMSQQVNQILPAQLNQLTQSTIKGVDISFGLDTYEQVTPSGGRETTTSLSYEVSKSLMNDRAQIEVSGRLSDLNDQPGSSDMSYTNVTFEYRLDSAATKYLKVYNEHSYEDVFEGEVVRTGVGITYRKRFKRIRDIWQRKKKNGTQKTHRK